MHTIVHVFIHIFILTHSYTLHIHNNHFIVFHPYSAPYTPTGNNYKKHSLTTCFPQISDVERKHLYQRMCQLVHCIMEYSVNVMCEEVMQEYSDNPDDWQYIEKEDGHYGFAEYV